MKMKINRLFENIGRLPCSAAAKSEDGFIMVITLLVLVLMTMLAFTAVLMTNVDLDVSGNSKKSVEAQYAAEAGLADGIRFLNHSSSKFFAKLTSIGTVTITPGEKNTSLTKTGTVGSYTYTSTISFKPDDGDLDHLGNATPVVMYDQANGYSSPAPLVPAVGFPVLRITSKATSPTGVSSIVEEEITKFVIPIDGKIRGACTANGNIQTKGSFFADGHDHNLDGSLTGGATDKPAIFAQGTMDLQKAVSGGTATGTFDQRIKSVADALGMTEADGKTFLDSPHFNKTLPAGNLNGFYYISIAAGATLSPGLNGSGLAVFHNPLYVPESQRVSTFGTAGYDATHSPPYYDPHLDSSQPPTVYNHFDDGTPGYVAACAPSILSANGNGTFNGVVIADKVDKFNGNLTINGALITLDSVVADVDMLTGNNTLNYSSAAIKKYVQSEGSISTKLSWRKKTNYGP